MTGAGGRTALIDAFDTLLLDLDGVVYVGPRAVPGASRHLARAREGGIRLAYVTNNASRPPDVIADQLRSVCVPADPADVVTSAQVAAREVAALVPEGSRVLVLGGAGLVQAVTGQGLIPVFDAADDPAAVVQGFSADMSWRQLAQGAYAVARGIPWVASNLDRTLPTEHGVAPGNGTLVEVIRSTAGVPTPRSVGKPARALFDDAVRRTGATRPLVVGDRLDTDIEGAHASDLPSLLVFTGVTGVADLVAAPPPLRPTYVGTDMGALFCPVPASAQEGPARDGSSASARCGDWIAGLEDGTAALKGSGTPMDGVRALTRLVWSAERPEDVDAERAAARLQERIAEDLTREGSDVG